MRKFLDEMRAKSDVAYKNALPYIDSHLKGAIAESAERGLREAVVKVQGYESGKHLERRCEELDIKARFYMSGSWAICEIKY